LLKVKMRPNKKRSIKMKLKKVPKQEPEEEDDIITSEEDEEDSQEEHEPQTSYRSPAGTGTGM